MKAYVLRNNELELMWSWEPDRPPSGEAPAATPPQIAGSTSSNGSSSPAEAQPPVTQETGEKSMKNDLGALDESVRAAGPVEAHPARTPTPISRAKTLEEWVPAAMAAVGGAVRQQEEEIQELREQVGRAEIEAKSWLAQVQALQSRVDTLEGRINVLLSGDQAYRANTRPDKPPDRIQNTAEPASPEVRSPVPRVEEQSQRIDAAATSDQSVLKEPQIVVEKPNEPAPASEPHSKVANQSGTIWKRLVWLVLAFGMPLAGWWAYTQRVVIDAFRDPDPPPTLRAKIPIPALTEALTEAPKVTPVDAPSVASQRVSVSVTAKEEIWLEVEADSNKVFAKVLPANQTKSFDASRQIRILTGNLAGTSVSYNGKQIGLLGHGHRVGAFLFTPQGWRDASARANGPRKASSAR